MMRTFLFTALACAVSLPGVAQERGADDDHGKLSFREEAMKRMSSAKYDEILGRRDNGPAPGTVAPDFELEPVKDYDFAVESGDGALRLSDFQGHKPVVLIFGSYT